MITTSNETPEQRPCGLVLMRATTVYRIYSGHSTTSKEYGNYVFTTPDEQTAADYIENRRNAYAQAGLPCCPWFYESHTTTT